MTESLRSSVSNIYHFPAEPAVKRQPQYTPCAVIVDFSRIITEFNPRTAVGYEFLYENGEYFNGEGLRNLMSICPIARLIECILIVERDGDGSICRFWEGLEAKFGNDMEFVQYSDEVLEALEVLGHYLTEMVDSELRRVLFPAGIRDGEQFDYYFDRWITPTTAVLTHISYNSAETA